MIGLTFRSAALLITLLLASGAAAELVIHADYSDPDVIRVGDDYYLVASSFQCVPGLPILHSKDLTNWTLIGYAVDRLPSPDFDRPQHGKGLWAPSLRYHDGYFWIYVGDPDRGIFMTRARDARGPWEPLTLVKEARGWIDPCPFWDDDGTLYLVHAWAKSRAGFNSVLTINRLSADGRRVIDEGTLVFDGRESQPTIEGPKLYKRNGWYYIFAPAGGVKHGWQAVLRAKSIYGPYEDRVILEDGMHQGAWVDDAFLHFQDRGAYGRVVHKQKLEWINDWPEITDSPGPVGAACGRPNPGESATTEVRGSDEFNAARLNLHWQWQGNPTPFTLRNGKLRLTPTPADLRNATNVLLQKFPAESFTATTSIDARALKQGERAGLVIMGTEYAALTIERTKKGLLLNDTIDVKGPIQLSVTVTPHAVCRFSYNGKPIGKPFVARPGRWIGAKAGIFGPADFDWFRIEPHEVTERASLVVAQDGSGDFRTIQEAVDAIPDGNDDNQLILIRNGVYREKVLIAKSYVSLVGEDREKTRIEFAELRKNWRATHPDDWGAAVINIGPEATDIIIANLTVHNDYGGDHDHQFAIRSMVNATRIAVLNANVIADGGDTFSPWNHESGLTYAADSYFEGWVDFVCPRGWAYITNSRFFGHNDAASIWHDGSKHEDQKLVIRHSSFDGVPNFPLGRNHRDAQFYVLDAKFSANMADRAIYPANAPDPRLWGERYYYASSHRDTGDYAWFADNLDTAAGAPRDEDITANWTFGGRWDVSKLPAVLPFAAIPFPENGWQWTDPAGVTLRWTQARNAQNEVIYLGTDKTDLRPTANGQRQTGPLQPGATYYWRINDGPLWSFRADPRTTRIALVGDSTMTEKSGWGRGFKSFVAESAALLNLARGGRSSKSYRTEGHWDDVLRRKPGYVFLQFGHNDVPGKGLDRETDLPTFRANMARYVDEARAAGATPILITPLTRRYFNAEGHIESDLNDYAAATKAVAAEKNVQLIDLHAKSIDLLETLGPAISPALGPLKTDTTLDKTHLNETGSALFGALMADEIRRAVPALAPHIREPKKPAPLAPWSTRMADSVMKRTPDPLWLDATDAPRWEYTPGLVLKAILEVAQRTGDARYWNYVKAYYDGMITADGTIRNYKLNEYNIDRVNPGKPLFALYEKTHDEKYKKALDTLRRQLREHPRTSEGGFWHKKRYPNQMWLDGLYMGATFLAEYGRVFNEPAAIDDAINQFVLMEKHARDDKTGLLYHGWDESREQKWADPKTGRSPAFWGRAMGWYAMGLVDTLDVVPLEHPRRGELLAILQRLADAITKVQDAKSGVWWQVVDQPARDGNYLEASVSTMFTYALLKATRMGYIDAKYKDAARRAYAGVVKEFIEVDKDGLVTLNRVCQVAGLGGDPEKGERYRDGTFTYYVNEKIRANDPKGVGPFIFASLEMERRR